MPRILRLQHVLTPLKLHLMPLNMVHKLLRMQLSKELTPNTAAKATKNAANVTKKAVRGVLVALEMA
eukprot:3595118-Prorocentrum_lima.AAC.1